MPDGDLRRSLGDDSLGEPRCADGGPEAGWSRCSLEIARRNQPPQRCEIFDRNFSSTLIVPSGDTAAGIGLHSHRVAPQHRLTDRHK